MKSIIIIAIVLLGCVAFNEALQCYSHSLCSVNCPQLAGAIVTCSSGDDRCYKTASPVGVSRGCSRDRCRIDIDANSIMANTCCEKDLCNSASTPKMTVSAIVMIIGAFLFARM